MKLNRNSTVCFFVLIIFCFFARTASAQDKIIQPSDFFPKFPEIEWGMTAENAEKAIKRTGASVLRPEKSQLAWLDKFSEEEGRGSLRFTDDNKLNEVVVQLYYSENGEAVYKDWLKKLTEIYGEASENAATADVTSNFWKFKNGFSIELRLLKADDGNRYMTDIHWVKQ